MYKMIYVNLPLPPSVNNLWRSISRKYGKISVIKSSKYKEWLHYAGSELNSQKPTPVCGEYCLEIFLPENMKGDIDNRIKAINDLLAQHGLIENDRFNKRLVVDFDKNISTSRCKIYVFSKNSDEIDKMERVERSLERDTSASLIKLTKNRPKLHKIAINSEENKSDVILNID